MTIYHRAHFSTRRLPSLLMALHVFTIGVCTAQSTPPDLTASGAIAALKTNANGNATPVYGDTFNLGPTGLRGWIHLNFSGFDYQASGRISDASRQILVTTASSPGNAVLAVDDVILGAIAASSGTVPSFSSDARKAFGTAITEAEKTGAGTLRVKRWRAGTTTDVNITIPTLGTYSATAPYNCPKSAQILANTRNQMVGELIANSNYLGGGHSGAINALALLASVPYVVNPGDPNESNYSTARTRLQTYARSLTIPPFQWAQDQETWIWDPAYQLIFLSEYYLLTNDSQVVPTINGFALWLAEFQSMFGTFGHGPGGLLQDDSGRRYASGYGPVNAVGNVANLAIVLGKKALLAASQPIDPKINTAIQRGAGFLSSYVNKGGIPYGEHTPTLWHASNGKDPAAAVFFGLQADRAVETEYFSRMSIASWVGVEVGHAGQELGILWAVLGAGMGGETAASAHFKQLLWRFDLTRRTNASFTHDGTYIDYYGGGSTDDGTYLGNSAASGVKGTAIYLLAYSLPLKQLHITGKDLNTVYNHDLDATKVANAVSAGYFPVDRANLSVPQLFTFLGHYDPVVRYNTSLELAAETLSSTDLTNLRALLASPDPNVRQSAAETLGIRKDATALPTLVGMLNGPNRDPDHWVRQKVAAAIRNYDASTVSTHRDALINAFIANAPADPDAIDWADPLQFSNSILSEVLFNQLAAYTINAPKTTHLYPALRAGLLLPTGYYRSPVTAFVRDRMNLTDLQNLFPELAVVVSADTPADRMFSGGTRADALAFMVENNITEGVEIAFAMFNDPNGFPWGSGAYVSVALNALISYGDAARYTLPRLREVQAYWNTRLWDGGLPHAQLRDTITFLENVISDPPATNLGKCVANSQIVTTTGAQTITLTGASPRGAFSFQKLTDPANGTLITNTASSFTYTPNAGFTGTDKFTFQTTDSLTTSNPATVAIIVGSSGTGIPGTYFDNADFTSPVLNRTDPQINFDWGTGSPDPSIGADTFSTRWSGYLLAPETGNYTLSSLTSDGVRAYLNGVPVINNLNDQSTRWTDGQSISLTAGQKVPLFLEYYEDTGSAVAKLKWTGPSFAGLNGNIIPQSYLFETNSSGGTDTTAPVISTLSPADNATGVAHAADLVATFSENIVRGTGNITIKNLSDGTQTIIPVTDTAQIAIAGATLIINPTTLLPGSKNHAVQIDATAIADTSGNSFAGIANDTSWNFTTTAPDTTKPTPNPMSFAVPPQTGSSTSITMTATTASDASGVEYRFNNVTLGTSSPWQNSPVHTATGLAPSNNYTFTVQARDKSAAGNTTTASAPASARTLGSGPLDLMSLNFYAYGSFSQDAVTLEAGESAGLGAFHVSGWQNYEVPWGLDSPAAPITLTSSVGSTATMRLNDVRNGGTYSELPHPLFAGGDGDLMNALCHGTEDPYDQSALFNMDVSNIPYPSYDLIVYLGANSVHGGDRTGKIVLNGGAERDFTLPAGSFNGFTESTNATTPGNYIVFRGLTNPSLNLKVWGNGFNHLGPTGFQIVNYGAITGDTLPPVISTLNPADDSTGVFLGASAVAVFSEPVVRGTGNITIKNLTDATQTTIPVTDTAQVSISGTVLTINPTANLAANKNYAIQIDETAIDDTAGNSFAGITNDTTWNFTTSNLNATPPPITDGMTVWLSADVVNTGDSTQVRISGSDTYVKKWNDLSGSAYNATQATTGDQPKYIASGLNGKPVLRFGQDNDDAGDRLYLGDLSASFPSGASVFVVATIDNDARYNLFGNRSNDDRWVADTWNESVPGSFRTGRSESPAFTFSDWPTTGSHVFCLESNSSEFEVLINGASIGTDSANYNSGSGSNWTIGNRATNGQQLRGDIAEVILYNRVLTAAEANQVGAYLTQKYGLVTNYGPPVISSLNPADNETGINTDLNLVATFNKAIVRGTGNITLKNLTDLTQTVIAVTDTTQVSISGSVMTINPTADLVSGKNYAIQIAPTAIQDTGGNSFSGITDDTTWNFTTATLFPYESWAFSGSLFILTTPDGANIATGPAETNFPLLLRFNSGNFPFNQAAADGSDIRFTTPTGFALSYQIEQWDAANGQAAVWVRIPSIAANARQEIKMYWGKTGVTSQSSGTAVFNAANGYCAVMHLNGNVLDSTGSISPVNGGATPSTAVIGSTAMNLSTGDITASNITNFPAGTNPASTGQIWLRPRKISGWSMPLAWGNADYYGWNTWKMQLGFWQSPSQILPAPLSCRGPADVDCSTALAANQWYHLVYTNLNGTGRVYVNGVLDGTASGNSFAITNPQGLAMTMADGDGDVDEARISNVARSANWIKLEYENQKPLQTLVGSLVPSGSNFSVTPTSVTMNEVATTTLTAQAGGAQKFYWIYKKNGQETVLATDQLTFNYAAPRISANDSAIIQFKAVFAGGTQTIDVPLTVIDTVPDPVFTLVPSTTSWDGRSTMTVTANVSNLAAMQAAGFGTLNYKWSVNGVAVTKQTANGTLTLTRSQGSGPLNVNLTIDNGGTPVSQSTVINVQEPASDPWVERTPGATEKPVNGQFFARNPSTGLGTIFYNGTQSGTPSTVFLKVYKTPNGGSETLEATHRQALVGGAYAFTAPITAGLNTYRVVYGTTTGGVDTNVATVTDLVCGDAFIIEGQSNALATDNSAPDDTTTNKWVRSYGLTSGWGYAISKGNDLQLGLWGWYLANRLVANNNMPICIINGAAGGTRIDMHMPNPTNHSLPLGSGWSEDIYANLYNRVVGANLSHGIRGLLWHQGEQDQGAIGPDGDYNYKFYQQYFVDISAAWKQDFPNLRNYYLYQIWPAACGETSRNDQLREVQRTLPYLYSNMKIMSTHGIVPGSGCHYEPAGYQVFSDLIGPLVEQDVYGVMPTAKLTAPNLQQAYFTTPAKTGIVLVFDQNVAWNPGAPTMLFLANAAGTTSGSVTGGSASGNTITLQVSGATNAATITYLKGLVSWQQANLLYGANGIAALTFADVPVQLIPDTTAPTPNPMSFASPPTSAGTTSISMTATTASDPSGVEYRFDNVTLATSSPWQNSPVYVATELDPSTSYTFIVQARDKSPAQNTTTASASASATTDAPDTTAPTPNPMTFASPPASAGLTSITMTATTATDPSGIEYRFNNVTLATSSPWQDSPAYTAIGLDPATSYTFTVQARDKSPAQNTTTASASASATTDTPDTTAPTPDPMTFASPPAALGQTSISMTATTATDPSGVEYFFECTAGGGNSSAWQDSPTYTDTGLTGATQYSYRVRARDKSAAQTATAWSATASVTTDTFPTATYTGANKTNGDNWNVAGNWTPSGIPTGAINVSIPASKQVTAQSATTPTYHGDLYIGSNALLSIGYNSNLPESYRALGTPGTTTISMASGSQLAVSRISGTYTIPGIQLDGNAIIRTGESTNTAPTLNFNHAITGAYTVTFQGKSDSKVNLNAANSFSALVADWTGYTNSEMTITAAAAGSLGNGDVTIKPFTDGKSCALLVISAANAMADTATLTLNGSSANKLTMNANDTIGKLVVNGARQPAGTYGKVGQSGVDYQVGWIKSTSTGILTVAGPSSNYWDLNGTDPGACTVADTPNAPATWDAANLFWNATADGTTTSPTFWSAGQAAVFAAGTDATGGYAVTVSGTQDIRGFTVGEGNVTLSGDGLQMTADSLVQVASGSSATIGNIISNDTTPRQLAKGGSGTITLSGANTYTGSTNIGSGTLSIPTIADAGNNSPLGNFASLGADGLTLAGGTLQYTGSTATTNRGFTLSADSTVDVSAAGTVLTLGASSGGGILTVTGGSGISLSLGSVTLVTTNLTLNPTTGSLTVASVTGWPAVINGATAPTLVLGGSASGNSLTGIYSGVGPLTKSGSGDWKLNGTNTYVGNTTVQAGNLIAGTNALNNANGAFGKQNGGEIALGVAGGNTAAGILISGGAFTVGRPIRLATSNTTDAGTRVLTLGGDSAHNSIFSGAIHLGTASQTSRGVRLAAAAGGQVTFSGVIQNPTGQDAAETAAAAALTAVTKVGPGTVVLTNTNTYTGATTVADGTLKLGANNVIPNASNVTIGTATLDADTRTDTAGTLNVTGTDSVINLGTGAALAFANSSGVTAGVWAGTLNITGTFVPGNDVDPGLGVNPGSIRFGTDNTGLTASQLAAIKVNGSGAGTYTLDAFGYLKPSGGGPGPVNSFVISAIASPQTVGTPINGITITAKDASNVTATSFTGTVTFGGTGGFTGTSASFTAGALSGVSVTPTVAGSNLTFTVDDGAGHTGSTTITTIQTRYAAWAGGSTFDDDANNDGIDNGMAWVLGVIDKNANAIPLLPTLDNTSDPDFFIFTYRRDDDANTDPNTTIKAEYGGILSGWTKATPGTDIIITPTDDGAGVGIDLVQVKIRRTLAVGGKLFARLSAVNAP